MNYATAEIWLIIVVMAIGTYLIRFSFLGIVGNRKMPAWLLRHLRYTPVAVIPGLVAPLILWPAATGGEPDLPRLLAAAATVGFGLATRSVIGAIVGGVGMLYLGLFLLA